jgi:PhnB protein
MAQISPYLHFNGNCREAMTFYKGCFGGELTLMSMEESPMASQVPPEQKKNIMHSSLKGGSFQIMAADMMGPEPAKKGTNFTIAVECSSNKETDAIFEKLASGGKILHAPKEEFFGYYGDLTDRYGFTWMLTHMKPNP